MTLDFDAKAFCDGLKATKPPYECPISDCGKIYKSLCGIQFHLYNYDHANPDSTCVSPPDSPKKKKSWHHRQTRSRSPTPPEFFRGRGDHQLSYAEAQKMVEIDVDGTVHRINICEPLELINPQIADKQLLASIEQDENQNNKKKSPAKLTIKRNDGPHLVSTTNAKTLKLLDPSFRLLEGDEDVTVSIDGNKGDCRPDKSYYRFVEKSAEELDNEVEYDMDEQDYVWLELHNKCRKSNGTKPIKPEVFEYLIDRLEKESFFQNQHTGNHTTPHIDEDAVCCICNDGECQNSNVILFCDMCNLAVHQECYGVPYIPEGQWLCRRCLQSPSHSIDCVLCPNKGGAFKQTDDARWCHVICALWVPEVGFSNYVFLEPIDSMCNIPPARWRLTCYICKMKGIGACIQCHKSNCYTAFHVTCAQQAGLHMSMEPIRINTANGTQLSVRKTAFCCAHTPADGDSSGDETSADKKAMTAEKIKTIRQKMRKARKILAEKRLSEPTQPMVSVPEIPRERIRRIALSMGPMQKKALFINRVHSYWLLKRQSRNGVPLLRRLQTTHQQRKQQSDHDKRANILLEQLRFWQRLRQNLEKARLLMELIRKREKLKREQMKVHQQDIELRIQPCSVLLRQTLLLLEDIDREHIFTQPVDPRQTVYLRRPSFYRYNYYKVPLYLEIIKNPMDFSTMRSKVDSHSYACFEEFEKDFNLIVDNCLFFNENDSAYYRLACRMRDQGGTVMRQCRRQVEAIGFDFSTGLHSDSTTAEYRKSIRAVTKPNETSSNEDEQKSELEQQLNELLEKLDETSSIRNPSARTRRAKSLRKEILVMRRKISLAKHRPRDTTEDEESDENADDTSAEDPTNHSGTEEDEAVFSNERSRSRHSSSVMVDVDGNDEEHAELRTRRRSSRISSLEDLKLLAQMEQNGSEVDNFEIHSPCTRRMSARSHSTPKRGGLRSESVKENPLEETKLTEKKDDEKISTHSSRKSSVSSIDDETSTSVSMPELEKIDLFEEEMTEKLTVAEATEEEESPHKSPRRGSRVGLRSHREELEQVDVLEKALPLHVDTDLPDDQASSCLVSDFKGEDEKTSPTEKSAAAEVKVDTSVRVDLTPLPDGISACAGGGCSPSGSVSGSSGTWSPREANGVSRRTSVLLSKTKTGVSKKSADAELVPKKRAIATRSHDETEPLKIVTDDLPDDGLNASSPKVTPSQRVLSPKSSNASIHSPSLVSPKHNSSKFFSTSPKGNSLSPKFNNVIRSTKREGDSSHSPKAISEPGSVKSSKAARKRSMSAHDAPSAKRLRLNSLPNGLEHSRKRKRMRTTSSSDSEGSLSGISDLDSDSDASSVDIDLQNGNFNGSDFTSLDTNINEDTVEGTLLHPLDLVWAKCPGYPWYPGMIIDPKMPKTGLVHYGVPIPPPPDNVLELESKHPNPVYLILFFDVRRTWQWLPREKLKLLGTDPTLDQRNVSAAQSSRERRAIKKAFNKAIAHMHKVAGVDNKVAIVSNSVCT